MKNLILSILLFNIINNIRYSNYKSNSHQHKQNYLLINGLSTLILINLVLYYIH
jgi:hypothetical protein